MRPGRSISIIRPKIDEPTGITTRPLTETGSEILMVKESPCLFSLVVRVWLLRQCNKVPAGTESTSVPTGDSAKEIPAVARRTASKAHLTMEYLLKGVSW